MILLKADGNGSGHSEQCKCMLFLPYTRECQSVSLGAKIMSIKL
jgi:hypothetical protein